MFIIKRVFFWLLVAMIFGTTQVSSASLVAASKKNQSQEQRVEVKSDKKPTILQSLGKFISFKWSQLNRYDVWNLGLSAVAVVGTYNVYQSLAKKTIISNHRHNPIVRHGNNPGNFHGDDDNDYPLYDNFPKPTNKPVKQDQITTIGSTSTTPSTSTTTSVAPPIVPPSEQKECLICMEEKEANDFCILPCGHNDYCRSCLVDNFYKNDNGNKSDNGKFCPNPQCKKPMTEEDLGVITAGNKEAGEKHANATVEEYKLQHKDDPTFRQCPQCPFFFFYENNIPLVEKCNNPTCDHVYCKNCLLSHGEKTSCQQAKEEIEAAKNPKKSDSASENWIKKHAKKCPQCQAPGLKTTGCDWIKCEGKTSTGQKCGHEYCWDCLKPHDHNIMLHMCEKACPQCRTLIRKNKYSSYTAEQCMGCNHIFCWKCLGACSNSTHVCPQDEEYEQIVQEDVNRANKRFQQQFNWGQIPQIPAVQPQPWQIPQNNRNAQPFNNQVFVDDLLFLVNEGIQQFKNQHNRNNPANHV